MGYIFGLVFVCPEDPSGPHWKGRDNVGPTGRTRQFGPENISETIANEKQGKQGTKTKHTPCRFRMATAVLRRPLLAAPLPAAAGAAGPSRFHIRRRRSQHPVLAVSSDSSKPVASTSSSSAGGDNPDEEPPVRPLLQELAVRRRPHLSFFVSESSKFQLSNCFHPLSDCRTAWFFRPSSSLSSPVTFVST